MKLEKENRQLKETIGELTLELKKRRVKRERSESEANEKLLEEIREIQGAHPARSYNRKRVWRLMKENNLLVPKRSKWTANPGKEQRSKPKTATPNEFWGTDMTNVMIPGEGWVYVPVVIDWGSKKRLSLHAGRTSKASDWQTALDEAVNTQFPQGI